MDDLISRRDAIDAFKKELTVGESKGNYVTICSAVGYEGARQILESLPSADPDTDAAYEQGRIQGHVEMRTELLMSLKEIVGDEAWKNI